MSNITRAVDDVTYAVAHRQELVSQISCSFAENDLSHNIVAPQSVIKFIIDRHIKLYGKSFYDPKSKFNVAGVDTVIRRDLPNTHKCGLWIIDEAHHVVRGNKWGKAVAMFPNALGLGVTATPGRADGMGLGRHADGVFDAMVQNHMRMAQLIIEGYLTPFKILAPPVQLGLNNDDIGSTGDYKRPRMVDEVRKSSILGDVVNHYLTYAPGKIGVTFATDIKSAEDICAGFNSAGVPAAILTGNTGDKKRAKAIDDLTSGRIKQLINVDIVGEGFNLPAIEVVSFARPTASYGLYVQQFGRALRLMDGKTEAIILDHVGNVIRHGLPTQDRHWSLDRRDRKASPKDPDALPLKSCLECLGVYEAIHKECPYCGHVNVPANRNKPEFVDGDLTLLDFSVIDELHKKIAHINKNIDEIALPVSAGRLACLSVQKKHRERQEMQEELRENMALWSGAKKEQGYTLNQRQRLFFHRFGVDVLTAQTLGRGDAEKLNEKVKGEL